MICSLGIGITSGMVGVGGGLLIVPLLTLAFGFTQERAGATSLAVLIFPIGVLAVITYHRAGLIDWHTAIVMAIGIAAGAPLGAYLVTRQLISPSALRIVFGVLLMYAALALLTRGLPALRSALIYTVAAVLIAGITWLERHLGRRPRVRRDVRQKRDYLMRSTPLDYQI